MPFNEKAHPSPHLYDYNPLFIKIQQNVNATESVSENVLERESATAALLRKQITTTILAPTLHLLTHHPPPPPRQVAETEAENGIEAEIGIRKKRKTAVSGTFQLVHVAFMTLWNDCGSIIKRLPSDYTAIAQR
jgi:hypothetical protein